MTDKIIPFDKNVNKIFDTRKVVSTLERLMEDVTKNACTSETVNAACNCADKITDILRLHLDVERLRSRFKANNDNL
jgi:hypothetical protein